MQAVAAKAVDTSATAIKEGNITGTNKDLRRLSMVESKNLLLKLGLTEDDIKGKLFGMGKPTLFLEHTSAAA